jgi:adenylate kinase family enzyme
MKQLTETLVKDTSKIAIYVVGYPGSGKSTIVDSIKTIGNGFSVYDIDKLNDLMMIFRKKPPGMSPDEYKKYIDKRMQELLHERRGIIITKVGRNKDSVKNEVEMLEKFGYSVMMIFLYNDPNVAWQRVKERESIRKVDKDYFDKAVKEINNNFAFFRNFFSKEGRYFHIFPSIFEYNSVEYIGELNFLHNKIEEFIRKSIKK